MVETLLMLTETQGNGQEIQLRRRSVRVDDDQYTVRSATCNSGT